MKVLVLGDVIIDKYIYGTSSRISPEAPVPVITYIDEKETRDKGGRSCRSVDPSSMDLIYFPVVIPSLHRPGNQRRTE